MLRAKAGEMVVHTTVHVPTLKMANTHAPICKCSIINTVSNFGDICSEPVTDCKQMNSDNCAQNEKVNTLVAMLKYGPLNFIFQLSSLPRSASILYNGS